MSFSLATRFGSGHVHDKPSALSISSYRYGVMRARKQGIRTRFGSFHVKASSSGSSGSEPARSGKDAASYDEEKDPDTNAWRKRPAAISVPSELKTPGAWFCIAGVLKVMFLMSSNTPVLSSLSVFGLPPVLGAYVTLIPAAIGLGLLARICVQRGWHTRRVFLPSALAATAFLVFLSGGLPGGSGPASVKADRSVAYVSSDVSNK
mmetsp:Transcript_24111/g.57429  ORF Transcript_24111/g.57429 Transcript_24111/m.57429 type:complete len:206 (+) Transcript_24111:151-768(+)